MVLAKDGRVHVPVSALRLLEVGARFCCAASSLSRGNIYVFIKKVSKFFFVHPSRPGADVLECTQTASNIPCCSRNPEDGKHGIYV